MKPTLLIADSNAELCDLYRRFFTGHGYDVEIAPDGLDCLEKLRRRAPSVLVLDPALHWGGGDGVLAWLREQRPAHGVPVILTATAGSRQDPAGFIEPPVVSYLPRPFALTALLERVHSAVPPRDRRGSSNPNGVPAYSELFIG